MWEKNKVAMISFRSQENRSELKYYYQGNTLLDKTTVIFLVSKRITNILEVKGYFPDMVISEV